MKCTRPLKGYWGHNDSGNRVIVWKPTDGYVDQPIDIPCGNCIDCRLLKAKQWAVRCVHEAKQYEENYFLTLTYKNKPYGNMIDHTHVQGFMKRLRRRLPPGVKSFGSAEYGTKNGRPHYHLLLFNAPLRETLKEWKPIRGNMYYLSSAVDAAWRDTKGNSIGFHSLSDLTFESAGYTARYVTKKYKHVCTNKCERPCLNIDELHYQWTDPITGEIFQRNKERTVALSKGIGKGWYEKWKNDVYPSDEIIMRGARMKPPTYYDYLLDKENVELSKKVKRKRRCKAKSMKVKSEPSASSKEIYAKVRLDMLKRNLEDVSEDYEY